MRITQLVLLVKMSTERSNVYMATKYFAVTKYYLTTKAGDDTNFCIFFFIQWIVNLFDFNLIYQMDGSHQNRFYI